MVFKGFHLPRSVLVALFLSLILHVGGLFVVLETAGLEELVYGDAEGYVTLAENIQSGAGFVSFVDGVAVPEVFRTPGLPFLLAPFTGSDAGLLTYLFIQSFIAALLIPFLVWHITRRLFGDRAGIVAAWLSVAEPLFLFFGWFPLTEIPFVILSLLFVAFLEKGWREGKAFSAVLSGLTAAIAVYVRPGNLLLFSMVLLMLAVYSFFKKRQRLVLIVFATLALFAALLPWYARVYHVTGTFALAGTGWRNVYTDYLASIRSLEKGTTFWDEKEQLKKEALPRFGIARSDLGNPKYAPILRDAAIAEIIQSPITVAKLQTLLYVSFFTNDGWLSYLNRLKIVPPAEGRQSATVAVLTRGWEGAIDVLRDMKDQFFIPIIGRAYTLSVTLFAFLYVIFSRKKSTYLIAFILLLAATASSVIGLGVEARLRVSILPFLLMLSAGGIAGAYDFFYGYRRAKRKSDFLKEKLLPIEVKTVAVVIPAYNEAAVITETLRELDRVLSSLPGVSYEIVVADNGSTDDTDGEVKRSGIPKSRVFRIQGKGKGLAIREAARVLNADVFAFCDADLSADPSVLPTMVERIKKGSLVVVGSRLLDTRLVDRGFFRTLSSKLFNYARMCILGIRVTDSQCGLKVFHKSALALIRESTEAGWFLDMEILARAEMSGMAIVEIPVQWTEFRYANRKSKLRILRDGFGALRAMVRIRRRLSKTDPAV